MKLSNIINKFIFALVILISTEAYSAIHYIRSGASGANNGNDWTNAWTALPASNSFVRGDTYYVADGNYGAQTFGKSASGTVLITVKKATVSDHGTGTGWNNTYGDGVATFTGTTPTWTVSSSYWVFDGQVGLGTSGHGFKITTTSTTSDSKLITVSTGVDSLTFKHIDLQHAGKNTNYKQDCIYWISTSANKSYGAVFEDCYMHNVNRLHMYVSYVYNLSINRCYMYDQHPLPVSQGGTIHAESISCNLANTGSMTPMNWVIKNSVFKDFSSSGAISPHDGIYSGCEIYNNIFYQTRADYSIGNGVICNSGGDTWTNFKVYNNTFYNIYSSSGTNTAIFYSNSGNNNIVKNNLTYGLSSSRIVGASVHDYNASQSATDNIGVETHGITLTSNPFINSLAADFRFKDGVQAINKGANLGSPYNYDLSGASRPTSGAWDIGAYEYQGTVAPKPTLPSISSVAINPKSGYVKINSTVTITVTETNNQTGLTPSKATINGKQVALTDQSNGTYRGTYTVAEGDNDGVNVEATNITLTGTGGTSAPASSSGSTLKIDAHKPTISSVVISPNSGTLNIGGSVTIIAAAGNYETGLTASKALINGKLIALTGQGNGTYTGVYTVQAGDTPGINIEATSIILTDAAGNVSTAKASTGSTLKIITTTTVTTIFSDGFENGSLNNWSSAQSGIITGPNSKFGNYGVEYNIQSITQKNLSKTLGQDYKDTYTSYYFKMDNSFSMVNNSESYLTTMRNAQNTVAWSLLLHRTSTGYQIKAQYNKTDLGTWVTINKGQWYWIKVHYLSNANGVAEWWIDGVSKGKFNGNLTSSSSQNFYPINLIGLDSNTIGKLYWDHFVVTPTNHDAGYVIIPAGKIVSVDSSTIVDENVPEISAEKKMDVTESPIQAFELDQNHPNPFNPSTTISFAIPKSGNVNLEIYNISGQRVQTLANNFMEAGKHSIVWNASSFSSGMFFCRIKSGEFEKTIKMTFMK